MSLKDIVLGLPNDLGLPSKTIEKVSVRVPRSVSPTISDVNMLKIGLVLVALIILNRLGSCDGKRRLVQDEDIGDEEQDKDKNQLRIFNDAAASRILGDDPNTPRFSCLYCENSGCTSRPDVCHNAIRCYTTVTRDSAGITRRSKGCTKKWDTAALYCNVHSFDGRKIHEASGSSGHYSFNCCKGEMCNNGTDWPLLPAVPVLDSDLSDGGSASNSEETDELQMSMSTELVLAVALPIIFLFIVVIIISVVMRRCHRKKMDNLATSLGLTGLLERGDGSVDELVGLRAQVVGDSTLREFQNEGNMTSGSGAGMPHLISRTLAKQIRLGERIGKGRYGEVWKAQWNGDSVAVKIFFSRDEDSWRRETQIYATVLLRHENILGYIGSDCTSLNSCTQLWLVTHFYANGSLYDFLNRDFGNLTSQKALTILLSSIKGIVHLHIEISGTQGKPAIAHRDIKSKNILVREDCSCVIADFGLAVMHSEADGQLDEHQNSRVGTKRYMSPEVLDQSIDKNKTIDAFRQVDIYAYALVMWEVLRRTRVCDDDPDSADAYALPFHDDVGPDPSFEEMRKVVCVDNRRPEVAEKWLPNPFFAAVCEIMRESWHESPSCRLSALRIKKNLSRLHKLPDIITEKTFLSKKFEGISQ